MAGARETRRGVIYRIIETLAATQHGVVARAQLLAAGISEATVDSLVRDGRLRLLHRGVYAVGPLRSPLEREMAAVLACGPGAYVSHRSAAALWGLLGEATRPEKVDVIVTRGEHTRRPGVAAHRVRCLRPDEVTLLNGVPVTTVPRTLLDLAGSAAARDVERAVALALHADRVDAAAVRALLTRHPRHRGSRRLSALVAADAEPARTRSEAEERLLALVRHAQLPPPRVNARVGRYEVDFYWAAERLVLEVDGLGFHSSRRMQASDRRRDAVLAAAGIVVIRVTWHQLVTEPYAVIARLAQALARRAAS